MPPRTPSRTAAPEEPASSSIATNVTPARPRWVVDSALELVGHTPLVRLHRLSPKSGGLVHAKLESLSPGGSVKDRAALRMVEAAERSGALRPGATIVEATSGNTGISLAMIAAVRGYRCVVVMPEDMSMERRHVLRAFGAEIVLTPVDEGMTGAVRRAGEIVRTTAGAWTSRQFDNPANPEAHATGTALEVLDQTSGEIAAFVAGVGTGGTLTGCARVLRERLGKAVRIVAVEPAKSAVLSGKPPGPHGIQGLGAGFVPGILDRTLIDEIVTVTDAAAERMSRRLAREEGLLVGPSAGANVHAAVEIARKVRGTVVTILCDTGERYLV